MKKKHRKDSLNQLAPWGLTDIKSRIVNGYSDELFGLRKF